MTEIEPRIFIDDLRLEDQEIVELVAEMLVEEFKEHWPDAWPDTESALAEIQAAFEPGKISRVALDEDGLVLGWIGGISNYNGNAWELHPLVVRGDRQGQGIGRTLVRDLEISIRDRGAITLYLGADDEDNMTSLGGVDLYPDVTDHIRHIKNTRRHPYEFYQKLGFVIVGVIPDANGMGKPDIIMAKRVAKGPSSLD